MSPSFTGGSLSFKGEKKNTKKKKVKSKHSLKDDTKIDAPSNVNDVEAELTEAERKALKRKQERERKELEKVAGKSHRERVEEFNDKLSKLTEHNDIPRVSNVTVKMQMLRCSIAYYNLYFSNEIALNLIQVSAAGNG